MGKQSAVDGRTRTLQSSPSATGIIYGSVLRLRERLSPQATDESRQQVTVKLGFFGHTVVIVLVDVHDQKNEKEEGDEGAEDGVAFDAG